MKSNEIKWTITALSVGFNLDRRTVAKRLESVEPIGISGRSKFYNLADAARAFYAPSAGIGLGEKIDKDHEAARLNKARADKTELEVEVLKGTLLQVADVESTWADHVLTSRASLLSIPPRLAMQVKSMADEPLPVIEDVITEAINTALKSLSSGESNKKDTKAVGSTAKADSKRVGRSKSKPKPRKRRRSRAV